MLKRNEKGRFVQREVNRKYDGFSIYQDKKGYEIMYISGREIKLHIYLWEKHFGEKPKGYDIHHINQIKNDNRLENLELLSFSDHQKVHAGWERSDGIWVGKPCKDCKKILPLNSFYQRKGLTPSNRCIFCSSIYYKKNITQEYKEKKKIYLKNYYSKNKEYILKRQKEKRKEVACG